uniref:Putative secreted peptide n=1 Tax=Anopheles braziliensis TaxID=58242 RepID=A0A2M3ZX34_9DIPT
MVAMTKSLLRLRRVQWRRTLVVVALPRALEPTSATVVVELVVVVMLITLLSCHRIKVARHRSCQRNQRSLARIGSVGSAERAIRV